MSIELICPECEKRIEVEDLNEMIALAYCAWCGRRGKSVGLVSADRYDAQMRHEELTKRLYCRDCGHIGLVEEFPFDAPPEEDMRERRCPRCHSDHAVNMASVQMCEKCDEVPARGRGDTWCEHCAEEFDSCQSVLPDEEEYDDRHYDR